MKKYAWVTSRFCHDALTLLLQISNFKKYGGVVAPHLAPHNVIVDPDLFRMAVGSAELATALLLWIPGFQRLANLVLIAIMSGAVGFRILKYCLVVRNVVFCSSDRLLLSVCCDVDLGFSRFAMLLFPLCELLILMMHTCVFAVCLIVRRHLPQRAIHCCRRFVGSPRSQVKAFVQHWWKMVHFVLLALLCRNRISKWTIQLFAFWQHNSK